jgi:flagellar hook-associated protein 3 FlgL
MRITGNRMMELAQAAVSRNQAKVGELAEQVSSGKRVAIPTDDPAAWIQGRRAEMRQALSEGATKVLDRAHDRLEFADGMLESMAEIVSHVQTLAVQGASAGYSASDRALLGDQVAGMLVTALGNANGRTPDGEYLFAGSLSLTAPFDAAGNYTGDTIGRDVPTDENTVVGETVPGSILTAAHGVDILPLLGRISTALLANDVPGLQATLGDLDIAVSQLASARTRMGVRLSLVDETREAHGNLTAQLTIEQSRLTEIDTVDAAGKLAVASNGLEVSRAVSANIAAMLKSAIG